MEDADDDENNGDASDESRTSSDELRTPSSVTAANSARSSPSSAPAVAVPALGQSAQDHMLDDLAREFGVEAQLVEALVQRLALQNQR